MESTHFVTGARSYWPTKAQSAQSQQCSQGKVATRTGPGSTFFGCDAAVGRVVALVSLPAQVPRMTAVKSYSRLMSSARSGEDGCIHGVKSSTSWKAMWFWAFLGQIFLSSCMAMQLPAENSLRPFMHSLFLRAEVVYLSESLSCPECRS